MQSTDRTRAHTPTLGEAAVDGLLAGVGAGVVMAAYLALANLSLGRGPAEWASRLDPSASASPAVGVLAHLAVAGVYGAAFGGAWRLTPWRPGSLGLLCGLAYGLGLWAVALTAISSTRAWTGGPGPFAGLPAGHILGAHGVYGLALAALFQRARR